jgi:excisionase family DNA binding protein
MRKLTNRPDATFLTLKQVCDLLNVSMLTCRKICSEAGAVRNFGGRTIRIDRDALMAYINSACAGNPAEQG